MASSIVYHYKYIYDNQQYLYIMHNRIILVVEMYIAVQLMILYIQYIKYIINILINTSYLYILYNAYSIVYHYKYVYNNQQYLYIMLIRIILVVAIYIALYYLYQF